MVPCSPSLRLLPINLDPSSLLDLIVPVAGIPTFWIVHTGRQCLTIESTDEVKGMWEGLRKSHHDKALVQGSCIQDQCWCDCIGTPRSFEPSHHCCISARPLHQQDSACFFVCLVPTVPVNGAICSSAPLCSSTSSWRHQFLATFYNKFHFSEFVST